MIPSGKALSDTEETHFVWHEHNPRALLLLLLANRHLRAEYNVSDRVCLPADIHTVIALARSVCRR